MKNDGGNGNEGEENETWWSEKKYSSKAKSNVKICVSKEK